MLEILLLAILVMLVLIYLQLRKNIKLTDSYFSAIDLSLRQFFVNIANGDAVVDRNRHEEILRQLRKIADESETTARILNEVHHPQTIEDVFNEAEKASNWLPNRN